MSRQKLADQTEERQKAEKEALAEEAAKGDKGRKRLVAVKNIPPHRNRGVRVWKGQSYTTGALEARAHLSAKIAKEA